MNYSVTVLLHAVNERCQGNCQPNDWPHEKRKATTTVDRRGHTHSRDCDTNTAKGDTKQKN